ncbi:MAG: VWA domain-containing protein [Bacteroidaceae bacterium]|nr:VWA domain-containing protein [Bacteroidaceae bacterium]
MKKKVFNLIVIDESGSMEIIREQAFSGMNETLATIRIMQEKYPDTDQRVSLITFDSSHTTWHYDNTPANETKDLRRDQYSPGGCTPLYDAIGKSVARLNSQAEENDNVLVTIITDGEENSSREWSLSMVRNLIEKLKKRNWTFSLIGTDNLDVDSMAKSMHIEATMRFKQNDEETMAMFCNERRALLKFNKNLSASKSVRSSDLFKLGEEDTDPLKG